MPSAREIPAFTFLHPGDDIVIRVTINKPVGRDQVDDITLVETLVHTSAIATLPEFIDTLKLSSLAVGEVDFHSSRLRLRPDPQIHEKEILVFRRSNRDYLDAWIRDRN